MSPWTCGCEHVTKSFGAQGSAVEAPAESPSTCHRAALVALMGASGSGKSTLLHLVGGLDSPTSGSIWVGEVDVAGLRGRRLVQHRRRVGFVFQAFNPDSGVDGGGERACPLIPYSSASSARARSRELLAEVGLSDRPDALPGQLSGGQQQRVAIARALVADPALILADEPTGNLDSENADTVMEVIATVAAARGAIVLLATHDPEVAGRCGRVVTMRDGRIVGDRSTDDVGA